MPSFLLTATDAHRSASNIRDERRGGHVLKTTSNAYLEREHTYWHG